MRNIGKIAMATALVVGLALDAGAAEGSETKESVIAPSAEMTHPIGVGDRIPAVVVQDAQGNDVELSKLLAVQKTALVVYRGGWCPFCNKHLSDIGAMQEEMAAAGYQVVGINADAPEDVLKSVESKKIPFTVLSDSDLKAARAFGLAFKLDDDTAKKYDGYGIKLRDSSGAPRYALPVPAFYLVDTDGTITFAYHNSDYKVRISKEEIRKAIESN